MKRILTIQDISCIGKCSLTVALPIISAMGVETAILPTSVLSTHTGFKAFTFKDLSDQIEPITQQWKNQGFHFDAIYTGYLGSIEQITQIKKVIDQFNTLDTMVVVDPAMAEDGKLYEGFDQRFVRQMATLCRKADITVPNVTEACLMTDTPYQTHFTEEEYKSLLHKVVGLGAHISIITGVSLSEGKIGVLGYDREKKEYFNYENHRLFSAYPGTGDVFASVLVGGLMRGLHWQKALPLACDFTVKAIELTEEDPSSSWYGVNFERAIPYLLERLTKIIG